ncbi:MAG: hypothetical protein WAV05_05195, partial [Anaerolineales bacterium]
RFQPMTGQKAKGRAVPALPSIPWIRGHLYFAEKGTFLFCIDILNDKYKREIGKFYYRVNI